MWDLARNCSATFWRFPLAYFEARRVGDTVARVRELEQIRQFLTSHSVTVVLDVVFTVVFLGRHVVLQSHAHARRHGLACRSMRCCRSPLRRRSERGCMRSSIEVRRTSPSSSKRSAGFKQ